MLSTNSLTTAELDGLVACEQMYPQMVRIRIVPAWARFFDFGTGRMPGFLSTLAEEAQQRG